MKADQAEEADEMTERIVVAVDETDAAAAALGWAVDLVAHEHALGHEVHTTLLTVHEPREFIGIEGYGLVKSAHAVAEAQRLLDELVAGEPGAGELERVIGGGDVTRTILDEARHQHADLIVVGTRHLGAIRQAMVGSVSQFVAAQRECPVAVVPAEATRADDRVLVGYDGSPGARAAIRWALEHCAGDVHVVQVVPTDAEIIDSREALAALVPALGPEAAGRVTAESVVGDPVAVLADPCWAAPQVVVGARKDLDDGDTIWGSVTTRLLAETTRPVVVVPPEPWNWGRHG
jgi:nucleotide-binding universal stress UspA family protein